MKKLSLITLAIAGISSAQAVEVFNDDQHKLDIYGRAYAGYLAGSEDGGGNTGDSYIRLGSRFESAMDHGLSAFGRVELQYDLNADEKSPNVRTRLAFAGVKGDFGSVAFGRQEDALDLISGDMVDIQFTNQFGYENKGGKRLNNVIKYQYTNNELFSFAADFQIDNDNVGGYNNSATRASYGAAAVYHSDLGLNLGAGYRLQENAEINNGDMWILGADYAINNSYAMASYSEQKNYAGTNSKDFKANLDDKYSVYELALGYKILPNLRTQVIYKNGEYQSEDQAKTDEVLLEARYDLSKQARIIASYKWDNVKNSADSKDHENEFTAAIRYDF